MIFIVFLFFCSAFGDISRTTKRQERHVSVGARSTVSVFKVQCVKLGSALPISRSGRVLTGPARTSIISRSTKRHTIKDNSRHTSPPEQAQRVTFHPIAEPTRCETSVAGLSHARCTLTYPKFWSLERDLVFVGYDYSQEANLSHRPPKAQNFHISYV